MPESNIEPSARLVITDRFSLELFTSDAVVALRLLSLDGVAQRVRHALRETKLYSAIFDSRIREELNRSALFWNTFRRCPYAFIGDFERECSVQSGDSMIIVSGPDCHSHSDLSLSSLTFRELTIELDEQLLLGELIGASESAQLTH